MRIENSNNMTANLKTTAAIRWVSLLLFLVLILPDASAQFYQRQLTRKAYHQISDVIASDVKGTELYQDLELSLPSKSNQRLSKSEQKQLRSLIKKAKEAYEQGSKIEAIGQYNAILEQYESRCHKHYLIEIYNNLAQSYQLAQMNDLSFIYFLLAIELSREYNYPKGIMNASFGLSLLYFQRREFVKVERCSRVAIAISNRIAPSQVHIYENTLAMGMTQSNNTDQALSLFQKAYQLAFIQSDSLSMSKYASNLSAYYLEIDRDLDSAFKYASIACNMFDQGIRTYTTSIGYNNLAITAVNLGMTDDFAIENALKSEETALKIKDWKNALFAVNTLAFIRRKQGDKDALIALQSKTIRYKDSLLMNENYAQNFRKDLNLKLQHKFQEIKEQQIMEENAIRRKNASITFWLIASSAGAVFLTITIFILIKNNRKQRKIQRLEFEKEQVEKQYVQDKLDLKTREIASLALLNSNVQKTLDVVKETLSKKKVSMAIQGEVEREVVSLRNEINLSKNFTAHLEEFQSNYNQTNPEFVKALRALGPKLTNGEIRHCIMLKNNLTSDEIANLLGVEKRSLRTIRYRIHQKLGIDKGIKLQDYLLAL